MCVELWSVKIVDILFCFQSKNRYVPNGCKRLVVVRYTLLEWDGCGKRKARCYFAIHPHRVYFAARIDNKNE